MAEAFDPYYKWLGIPPAEQPPNHYRLLGVTLFETDPDVIGNAADQRMAHVRTFQVGRHSDLSQRILNEIAAARVCLLNAEKKADYDRGLQQQAANVPHLDVPIAVPPLPAAPPMPAASMPQTPPMPLAPPLPPAPPMFSFDGPPAMPLAPTPPPPQVESMMSAGAMPVVTAPPVSWFDNAAPQYHARPNKSVWPGVVVFIGALTIVGLVLFLAWQNSLREEQLRPPSRSHAAAPTIADPAAIPATGGDSTAPPQPPPQPLPTKPKVPPAKSPTPGKPGVGAVPSPRPGEPAIKPEAPKPESPARGTGQEPMQPATGKPQRRPAPDAAARKQAEAKLAAVLSKGAVSAWRDAAQEANRDPAERFVLLAKAVDAAVAAYDVAAAMELIDEKARQFEIEAVAEKVQTLTAMRAAAPSPESSAAWTEQAMVIVEQPASPLPRDQLLQFAEMVIGGARKSRDTDLIKRATLRFLKLRDAAN